MSTLQIGHLEKKLHNLFDHKIDLTDLGATDKELESKFLTRALSAYSITLLATAEPDQVAPFVTDAGDDNGIDCFFYDNSTKIMYFCQSKWIKDGKGEPDLGDIKKFTDGIRDLVNLRFDRFNSKLTKHITLIRQVLDDPSTKYVALLTYTGVNSLAIHGQRSINDLLDEMNDAGDLLTVNIHNQSFLHNSLIKDVSKSPITIDIGLKYWGKIDSPQRSFYGQLNASSIAEWWNQHNNSLFDKNLRSVLGETDVNAEIRQTLQDDPDNFWFFNNGITILADKITKTMTGGGDTDFGTFHCQNISIVNGAQTVSTIGKFANLDIEKVKKANVQCRIIELNDAPIGLSDLITKTNNRQNKIENRDFASLDPVQIRIRSELELEGYSYIIQRNENIRKDEVTFDLVDSTTALACISLDPNLFVQLKREIGKLWEDLTKPPYKILFNPSTSTLSVLRAVLIQRKIDEAITTLLNENIADGYTSNILIHGNRLIAARIYKDLPIAKLSDPKFKISDLDNYNYKENINKYLTITVNLIDEHYNNAVIPTLFKNLTKVSHIFSLL